ncbi:hypothetical protein MHTCC0001_09790 [Flavobacteriaceae bacterium MHTCC 0001]
MKTQKLKNVISHYKRWRQDNPDTWIEHCKNQQNLEDAIMYAALAENHLGKRHPHQYRRKKLNLEKFAGKLIDKKDEIQDTKTFEELIIIVESCKVHDIGKLTIYNTADRIASKLGLAPEYIYLHSGTRIGAEKLLERRLKHKYIRKADLPSPFQDIDLSPSEIEDILCIYKDKFDGDLTELNSFKKC